VLAGQSQMVVGTIELDVVSVSLGQSFHIGDDFVQTTLSSGDGGGEVGVHTSTVPVALNWLWFKSDINTVIFSDSLENVSGHPELIASVDTLNWADLEFPLAWEDFSVQT